MAIKSLSIRPLKDVSSLKDFHCGIQAMDGFIHSGLEDSMKNHYCNAYSVHFGEEVVAMFALSFDSLELDSDSLEEMNEGFSCNKPEMSKGYIDYYSCRFEPCEFKKPNKETLRMFRAIYPKVVE